MLTKALLFTLIAACGVPSGAAADPPEPDELPREQPEEPPERDDFCCVEVDKAYGEGCQTISEKQIDSCANVLHCSGDWYKKDGNVYCA
jgi:hypothetical protein